MKTNTTKKILKSLAVAGLSQIPIASAFSTFIGEYANSSWQERREETEKTILEKIAQQDKKFEERMRAKDNFASILGTAYNSAVADVEKDKVPLYANAFINAINDETLENAKLHIFLNLLRDFSILHIKVLQYFATCHMTSYTVQRHMNSFLNSFRMRSQEEVILDIIGQTDPDIVKDAYLFSTVMNDLHAKKLIKVPNLSELQSIGLTIDKTINKMTTQLGDEFLKFIKDNSNNE